MNIPNDEIHIWQEKLDVPLVLINEYKKILSSDEIQKANRFKFERDKINYIVGRAQLRKILSQYLNCNPTEIKFSYEEKGKPYLANNPLKFNLAHSKHYAVYAIALNAEVGIDIEYMREVSEMIELSKRFFSKKEIDEILGIEKQKLKLAFFNCWTRKEAFIKAIGDGLSYPLEDFSVTMKPEASPKVYWMKENDTELDLWNLYNVDIAENYVSSLAIKAKDKKIVIKNLKH